MILDHIMELQQRYYANALMSQTRAMTVEAEERPRWKFRGGAEPKITRRSRGRGNWFETKARPRQRAAEAEPRLRQAKKLPRGKAAASRTTSLQQTRPDCG